MQNLIIYFEDAFWYFCHYQFTTLLPFFIKILDHLFSRNIFLWLFQLIGTPKNLKQFPEITIISVEKTTSTRYKLAFSLAKSSSKLHHSHLKSIIHWFPHCIFMLHFDLKKDQKYMLQLSCEGLKYNNVYKWRHKIDKKNCPQLKVLSWIHAKFEYYA